MKKFVELIQRVHNERFSVVMNKIVAEKIPVAFLSLAPVVNAIQIVNNLRGQGFNITTLITLDPSLPPPDLRIDFNIVHLRDFIKVKLDLKYIFVIGNINLDARVATKYLPEYKVLSLDTTPAYNEFIYNIFMENLKNLQKVYESLIDGNSKETFCGYWLARISNQFSEFVYSDTPHYIAHGFIPERDSIVIDCGACDGATSAMFTNMGYQVYAFEMDKSNFEIAKKIAKEKNFKIENVGLGSYKHEMRYTHDEKNIGGSHLDENGTEITRIITLDQYVLENKIPRVDFIKFDVEGAELDILKGATATIVRWKPILALSAYHKLDDFWTLMNFVKSIRSDYEFAIRHYPETRDNDPFGFQNGQEDLYVSLGVEPDKRTAAECVLFAR